MAAQHANSLEAGWLVDMTKRCSASPFSSTTDVSTSTGSIRDVRSCQQAAQLVKAGVPIGLFVRGVCVLWIDGENCAATEAIYRIKGERRVGRPFGTVLQAAAFVELLDENKLPASLRNVLLDADELAARLGDLCLIRAPITTDAAEKLPPSMVSSTPDGTYWLQNWIPFEHQAVCLLVETMRKQNVTLPAVTSMNISGQAELVEQGAGIEFCQAHRIPLFLADPANTGIIRGSFPIIQVDQTGITLVREGHFPGFLFRYLLDAEVDISQAVPSKFPLFQTHSMAAARNTPAYQLRREMIARLEG